MTRLADLADTDTVAACPECDNGSVALNAPGGYSNKGDCKRYRCGACYARFEEFVERAPRSAGARTRCGLAKRLCDADPDEVGP